ncbi:hypothetical protein NCS56_00009300 [Fusarium sp. Ph1]|nr:hypothetical protein NCS56_00009300 [Fusarium sp. Ph1]
MELYKESDPQLNWLPLLVGISEGNTNILDNDPDFFRCCQPLDLATWDGQDHVLGWLADRGAVATDVERPRFIESKTADHFVSDAATAEGRWKPVMYQQAARLQETYPLTPYPHFVWYSPELKHTDIFPRLLRLYNSQHGNCLNFDEHRYLTDGGNVIHLANWIHWIWLDMLLSASDPVPILESAFFKGPSIFGQTGMDAASVAERLRFEFPADMFGQKSLLNSIALLSVHPFPKHVSLRAPEVFSHLLNSGSEADSTSCAYFIILSYLLRFESSRLDVFPTFELYPLLIDAPL